MLVGPRGHSVRPGTATQAGVARFRSDGCLAGSCGPSPAETPGRSRRSSSMNKRLHRAFVLKEELQLLYHLPDPDRATEHLAAWLTLQAQTVRQARRHAPQVPRRDPSRRAARPQQHPTRGTDLKGAADQPRSYRSSAPSISAPALSTSSYRRPQLVSRTPNGASLRPAPGIRLEAVLKANHVEQARGRMAAG